MLYLQDVYNSNVYPCPAEHVREHFDLFSRSKQTTLSISTGFYVTLCNFKLTIRPLLLLLVVFVSSCAVVTGEREPVEVFSDRRIASPVFEFPSDCANHLANTRHSIERSKRSGQFDERLVVASWNTKKSSGETWKSDLQQLTEVADILLLQEAVMVAKVAEVLPYPFVALAEGFRSPAGPSGLISASHVGPRSSCRFVHKEPLFGTRKASNLIYYPLSSRRETLLVANIHAINFSIGLGAFEEQLTDLATLLHRHDGPIIFAGDFNVWNKRRAELVGRMIENLGMAELAFNPDSRKAAFGHILDRIYSRGLPLIEASTIRLESSDHNALIAVWDISNEELSAAGR